MRTRTRILLAFVGVQLLLGLATCCLAWRWVDRSMAREAEASAQTIGRVLAEAPSPLTQPWIHDWVRELTGHEFTVLASAGPMRPGTVLVATRDSGAIEIDYRTEAYRRQERQVLAGTLALVLAGTGVFALVSLLVARRLAVPLERLALAARTIGAGDLERVVEPTGSGEVLSLAVELEQMRRRLILLERQRLQAERLHTLGTFTATIAHEVRNPLSAIRLSVQLLARRLPGETSLAVVQEEIERLDLIVDQLLGFSKGMQVSLCRACDLRQTAESVARLLARQADHAGVQLRIEGQARVLADAGRLRQLLMNLLLNAIQAQHGGGAVVVRLLADGLAVEDEGPGVDPALVPHAVHPPLPPGARAAAAWACTWPRRWPRPMARC